MFWGLALVVLVILCACLETELGKVVIGLGVLGLGLLLLKWITGLSLLAVLAKGCAVVIVVLLVGSLVLAILG